MGTAAGLWCVYVAFSPEWEVLGTFVSRRGEVGSDLARLFPTGCRSLSFSDCNSAQKSACRLLERRFSTRPGQNPAAGGGFFTIWGRIGPD